ncbi:hypothetical protein K437DRAFT_171766 [Tilletiaria anomala UBC 951]|uniref:Palmitoyltransferase n=1 Tax=Tilletiaria anomala (strain ATCC 24038 / CBS 436.72 / UBC 951) TaxID=1037660 RepID=A0A066VMT1_TILAU|nr:uncharacterized protein K437DRAFT_171766 [Tilletiaria anomala UBC 951]KDN41598.1 hypothetical protein K437DRAFT_171766 [Tilletiaria anomala UBC 951]
MLHQCALDGSLMRCWRDGCKGRWKPARTRHCGDCRTCRIGFDHHCPWFDADVIAQHTMPSFLLFLLLAALLLILALAPLVHGAYADFNVLLHVAWAHPHMHTRWWQRRWTWYGGPTLRYGGALVVAARLLREEAYPSRGRGERAASLHAPVTLSIAALLTAVALGLLTTTLHMTTRGDLSVDVMRQRAHSAVVSQQRRKGEKARALAAAAVPQTSSSTASNLSPTMYFWVPLHLLSDGAAGAGTRQQPHLDVPRTIREAGGIVVSTTADGGDEEAVRPYDWGFWRNLQLILEKPARQKDAMQWPISPAARQALVARAVAAVREMDKEKGS